MTRPDLRTPLDLRSLDKCGPVADAADWLHAITGWPTRIAKARDGYIVVASQFIIARHERCYVALKVPNTELSK